MIADFSVRMKGYSLRKHLAAREKGFDNDYYPIYAPKTRITVSRCVPHMVVDEDGALMFIVIPRWLSSKHTVSSSLCSALYGEADYLETAGLGNSVVTGLCTSKLRLSQSL